MQAAHRLTNGRLVGPPLGHSADLPGGGAATEVSAELVDAGPAVSARRTRAFVNVEQLPKRVQLPLQPIHLQHAQASQIVRTKRATVKLLVLPCSAANIAALHVDVV